MQVVERLLRREGMPDDDRRLQEMAVKECHRMGRLIASLEQLGPAEERRMVLVEVGDLIQEVARLKARTATKAPIQVECSLPTDEYYVFGIRSQLRRALVNLVDNAIEAMADRGGRLSLSVDPADSEVTIQVGDTGNGTASNPMFRVGFSSPSSVPNPTPLAPVWD